MGERQNEPFQLSFNAAFKVDFQGSRVTSDGGLVLVRELDERLGLSDLIAEHLNQIEIVFSLLQRKTLNGASFKTKDQLCDAIEAFFRGHNERAKPFRWRKRDVKGSQLKNTIINLRN